jgi:hypothetical protein
MDKVKLTKKAKEKHFNDLLSKVEESLKLMSIYCSGCTILKSEGCCTYEAPAPTINDCCSICRKPIYHSI